MCVCVCVDLHDTGLTVSWVGTDEASAVEEGLEVRFEIEFEMHAFALAFARYCLPERSVNT